MLRSGDTGTLVTMAIPPTLSVLGSATGLTESPSRQKRRQLPFLVVAATNCRLPMFLTRARSVTVAPAPCATQTLSTLRSGWLTGFSANCPIHPLNPRAKVPEKRLRLTPGRRIQEEAALYGSVLSAYQLRLSPGAVQASRPTTHLRGLRIDLAVRFILTSISCCVLAYLISMTFLLML